MLLKSKELCSYDKATQEDHPAILPFCSIGDNCRVAMCWNIETLEQGCDRFQFLNTRLMYGNWIVFFFLIADI